MKETILVVRAKVDRIECKIKLINVTSNQNTTANTKPNKKYGALFVELGL